MIVTERVTYVKRTYNNYNYMMEDRKNIIKVYGKEPRLTAKIVKGTFIGTATII